MSAVIKHYNGGMISGKICLLLHFGITESNLTVQYVSSSEFQIWQRVQFRPLI